MDIQQYLGSKDSSWRESDGMKLETRYQETDLDISQESTELTR